MALVEMPEKEARSLMKLCKCTEEETRKLLLGLKNVKKVYRGKLACDHVTYLYLEVII